MKKVFLFAGLFLALTLTSCTPTDSTSNNTDSTTTVVDTPATDSLITDSLSTDTTISTDPSTNPDSIQASMKKSSQMQDSTNNL